jgi:CCR4-NOT transcriptional regulation complex NOT5 subunit
MQKSKEEESKGGGESLKQITFNMDFSKYQPFVEEVKSKNFNTLDYLGVSIKNSISQQDSITYTPKNLSFIQTKFPSIPLPLKQEDFEKFNDDTLFLMFFIQQVSFL